MHVSGKRRNARSWRISIEKRIQNSDVPAMLSALRNFFHRPAIRFGLARDGRSRFRNPRFVSFMAQSNRKTLNTDFQDAVLRGRKLAKQVFLVLIAAGTAWFVLESAKALSTF